MNKFIRRMLLPFVTLFLLARPLIAQETPTAVPEPTAIPTVEATETSIPVGTPEPTTTAVPTETAIPTETAVPTETVSPTQTAIPASPTPIVVDVYEPDAPDAPATYIEEQRRSFNPRGDVDYIEYFIKAGSHVWIETEILGGGADTVIEIYRDNGDGVLSPNELFASNDDWEGLGFGSRSSIISQVGMRIIVAVKNKSLAYSPQTEYLFRIVDSLYATPTAVFDPTSTPKPNHTATPYPTYTPYPTGTPPPTAVPPTVMPTVKPVQPAAPRPPAATATPEVGPALRVNIFVDLDEDGLLDPGEGAHNVVVIATSIDGQWQSSGVTSEGSLVIEYETGLTEFLVDVPYLHRAGRLTGAESGELNFIIEPPSFPLQLP